MPGLLNIVSYPNKLAMDLESSNLSTDTEIHSREHYAAFSAGVQHIDWSKLKVLDESHVVSRGMS